MNVKQLFADEDAVSPVIGVILMVAITVILAAVIGTFVLGLGENVQDSAPQANFQFNYSDTGGDGFDDGDADDDQMGITHTGGEDVPRDTVSVQIAGTELSTFQQDWTDPVSTGDTLVYVETAGTAIAAGDDVRVVWTSPSGGTSNTIGQSTVPS